MRRALFFLLLPTLAVGQVLPLSKSGTGTGTNTGDVTLTAVGSSPSANGASLSGQALTLQPADATHPGVVTTGTQTIGGVKTFATGPTSQGTIATNGVVSTALATPTNATFTLSSGTLTSATYYYRVTALDAAGETLPSTETSLAITGPAGVNVNWGAVAGATSYKVYGRTTGAELLMATVSAPTVTWLDNGSVTPSGALPTLGTSASISTVSSFTARDITTTAASGAVALSGANGSKFCPGATTACITSDGSKLTLPLVNGLNNSGSIGTLNVATQPSGYNTYLSLIGNAPDGATAAGVVLKASVALSTAGAEVVQVFNTTTKVAAIDKDGSYRQVAAPTLQTCAAGTLFLETVQPGGSAGKYSKKCFCVSDTQASPTYAWKNTTGVFATEAASVGNTTTCPDP